MKNKIYQGEKIAIVGQLKEDEVVTTDYTLECRVYSNIYKLLQTIPLTLLPGTTKYVGEINTNQLLGTVRIRFIAKTPSGDIVINNEDIIKQIYS